MAWLLRQGEVLASISLAGSRAARARGFAARDEADGAMFLSPLRVPHTIGVRVPLDVAFLDPELVVVETTTLAPLRVGMWRRGATSVLEAEAGAFDRWALRPGDRLEITP